MKFASSTKNLGQNLLNNTITAKETMIDLNNITTMEDIAKINEEIKEGRLLISSEEWIELTNIASRIDETIKAEAEPV